ncbi:transcription-repair coupling factor (superfamily II helicase) [Sphingobium sp. AP50]|uniref:DEAD/DEAH box helicase n=1 Tax=Sphingobium sp. AP50 TaxID=1884369 RepID=UPI0008CC1709|nr:DEAD/DEAH box helicase [Sphingobium sp. AP50]SEJ97892.1 transcription-repair coupling factor (superfamily II helicase) [Sphingobium sp. AP50]
MSVALGIGATALMLLDALQNGDLLYLADDEQEAEAVADALMSFAPDDHVVFLPSSDTLPGDGAPATPSNIGKRVAALRHLRQLAEKSKRRPLATIMSGEAAARLYADPADFDAAPPSLQLGERIDPINFAAEMERLGYVVDDRVDEPGEVAVRGEVIDIFPSDAGLPARIDIAAGRIVGIRLYDPITQLTQEPCERLEIGRAAEPESKKVTILAHLRPGRLYVSVKAEQRRARFLRLATEAASNSGSAIDAAAQSLWAKDLAAWCAGDPADFDVAPIPRFVEERSPLSALKRFAAPQLQEGKRLLLVGSERDVRFLRPKIAKTFKAAVEAVGSIAAVHELAPGAIAVLVAPVDRGADGSELIMIAAADLLGSRAIIGAAQDSVAVGLAQAVGDIRAGDLVVHQDHGVARVMGLEPDPGEGDAELIALEYADGARRLVTSQEAGLIWRYGADGDAVRLDKLDGSSWQKRRVAIDEAVAQGARDLLRLAQERAQVKAPIIEPDSAAYERFVASFPFNETADQARAIQAVRDDLGSGRPMDRLVIGDVGYGKTEVALRAAALASLAGYQVILAAPTTVLVRQHIETFQRRFATTGMVVAGLSRLSSAAEKRAAKAGLADGSIDIVIGTAAVMAKDIRYARLGLVIIDEEQRFGAADKKRLRRRTDLHLLVMSATPIPRTLHRAMIGLQQMSVIATPPARRQPIRTSLANPDDAMIRTALLRERSRGGQSFVVVPRIEDLAPLVERLDRIVPDLALIQAHGKMAAAAIDDAMVRFGRGEGDVLLATNIIEAGLDVPRANTMVIWRADRFGLAQLHQLRGRVGRGNRRGQVILMTEAGEIAERTMKRLRTLATYDRLGAGFAISTADLDQRGAGDPLADTQAGHMKLIGVDLYQHLFQAALKEARGEDAGLWTPELNLGSAGCLPSEWIPDADIRLGLYVRLSRLGDETGLDALEGELADRFGPLPPAAERLIDASRIAILARATGIARIDAGPAAIAITPREAAQDMSKCVGLAKKDGRWLLKEQTDDADRLARVTSLLESIGA